MNDTNHDKKMTGIADNCDALRTTSGQEISDNVGVDAGIPFRSRDEAIARLCEKVFGASPVYPDILPRIFIPDPYGNGLDTMPGEMVATTAPPLVQIDKDGIIRPVQWYGEPTTDPSNAIDQAAIDERIYALDQYHLACRQLGINTLSTDPGDTLLDAVWRLKEELTEMRKDYHCLAELLDGYNATEYWANLQRLKQELSNAQARVSELLKAVEISDQDALRWREHCSRERQQRDALAEAMIPAMTRAYARGYNHGHEDTVESTFMPTHASDELTFFADDIRQMLLDGSQPEAHSALAAVRGGEK